MVPWASSALISEANANAGKTNFGSCADLTDEVWAEAARHFDEVALASLLVAIGLINFFNRINVATRQVAGSVPLPA